MTYWGFQHAMPIAGAEASLAPLGLVTVAALLPKSFELRLVDLNVEPLTDEALRAADAVLVGGMLVQAPSMLEVVARARALGRPTVVGGPAVGATPERFHGADVVFVGEAEGRAEELLQAIERVRARPPGAEAGPLVLEPTGARPAITSSPVPRFDLLRRDKYVSVCVQFSRGCPYACEFCDVTTQFGRTPRVKTPAQIVAELEALHALGYRGSIFLVDDNFIGNKRAVRALLPELRTFQRRHGRPFDFYTEATVTLATDPALVAAMVEAGFGAVFLGIETPSKVSLAGASKNQNLHLDLSAAVESLTKAGLEVMGGFIVGFDGDDPSIFEEQRAFIASLPIPMAMVGVLGALPGTPLWHRLLGEGRLRSSADGDAFARPNFEPAMDERTLLVGYAELLASLYSPEAYYARCRSYLAQAAGAAIPGRGITRRELRAAVRAFWHLGVKSPRRGHFWRLVGSALRVAPSRVSRAVVQAIRGEHLIRYTEEEVLPRIAASLVELDEERRVAAAQPAAGARRVPVRPALPASAVRAPGLAKSLRPEVPLVALRARPANAQAVRPSA
ncbi:MAG: B12-binding domain-containing radical SAM protein [Myxococcales bacterium]|nr:B12-binding domain-containing radical SAM protein [Myxococcales bacterium]